jgi:hypothetical protein
VRVRAKVDGQGDEDERAERDPGKHLGSFEWWVVSKVWPAR